MPVRKPLYANVMKLVITTLLILLTSLTKAQDLKIISRTIDSLKQVDQEVRAEFRKAINNNNDSLNLAQISVNIRYADSLNYIIIKDIFKKFGFLGLNKVSETTSHNFWLLVQHADRHPDFQAKVLDSMKIEVNKNNASNINYAYLFDRVNVNSGKPQLYGTQLELNKNETSYVLKPTVDIENLNKRRQEINLEPIENYIKEMNEHLKGSLKN